MDEIRVKKDALLEKVKANREKHRELFLKAQVGYRELAIEEMERRLKDARDGKVIIRVIAMPEPVDHTDDYDNVIAMLEMSVEEEVMIDAVAFSQYVRDNWAWKHQAFTTNTAYAAKMIPRNQ